MAETIHVRGEGGQVITMDLPLPEGIADRYAKGLLPRVNADGSPYGGGHVPAPAGASPLTAGVAPRPGATARKPEWVAWAVAVHGLTQGDAEALTVTALKDLPDLPDDQAADEDEEEPAAAHAGRPPLDAPKSQWIAYVVGRGRLSAEDAANYTKDDLIDMES